MSDFDKEEAMELNEYMAEALDEMSGRVALMQNELQSLDETLQKLIKELDRFLTQEQ
jgi:hypothetical protein